MTIKVWGLLITLDHNYHFNAQGSLKCPKCGEVSKVDESGTLMGGCELHLFCPCGNKALDIFGTGQWLYDSVLVEKVG
jgi:hypothetical protein